MPSRCSCTSIFPLSWPTIQRVCARFVMTTTPTCGCCYHGGEAIPWFCTTVMPYNGHVLLKRFLHISPSNAITPRGEPGHDSWHKIRPVLDHLNNNFKEDYVSNVNVSVDESMIGMKNRHIHIQYLRNKRHCRFGIKKVRSLRSSTELINEEGSRGPFWGTVHKKGTQVCRHKVFLGTAHAF